MSLVILTFLTLTSSQTLIGWEYEIGAHSHKLGPKSQLLAHIEISTLQHFLGFGVKVIKLWQELCH